MVNNDPTKGEVHRRRWFYDELLDRLAQELTVIEEAKQQISDLSTKVERFGFDDSELTTHRETIAEVSRDMRGKAYSYRFNQNFLRDLHPFIIGPATLESLINKQPETYEYVRDSKLPFDNMFFEFLEPIPMKLPFYNFEKNLRGLSLNRNRNDPFLTYFTKLYYSDSPEDVVSLSLHFNPENLNQTQGKITCFQGKRFNPRNMDTSGVYVFIADLKTNKVHYCTHDDDRENLSKRKISQQEAYKILEEQSKRGEGDFLNETYFRREANFSDFDAYETIHQVTNLCVNFVNYINAHNVTIVNRERESTYLDRRPNGQRKKRTITRPFHLIVLKDQVIERPGGPGEKTWELQERIFVRGHDRRYRNEEGAIRLTSWIPPHIKGPPNAPFHEQRYQVLYEKLGREIQMFRDLGLRHDSEMWVGR